MKITSDSVFTPKPGTLVLVHYDQNITPLEWVDEFVRSKFVTDNVVVNHVNNDVRRMCITEARVQARLGQKIVVCLMPIDPEDKHQSFGTEADIVLNIQKEGYNICKWRTSEYVYAKTLHPL